MPDERPIVEQKKRGRLIDGSVPLDVDIEFINDFALKLQIEYIAEWPDKGDSWRDIDIEVLLNKLLEEMAEVETAGDYLPTFLEELIDLGLVAAMVWSAVTPVKV